MTHKEALESLRALIKKHDIILGWGEKPTTLEELIIARDGPELLNEIDKAIETVYD